MKVGDIVKKGDIIADGPSTDLGELALGRNVLVAFMPWNGYNFEDAILISERIVKDDIFTSIHIEEFEVMAPRHQARAGGNHARHPERRGEALHNLGEDGIVRIGAEVKPGDILVGKITPKSESPMTPEEKLLRAIFGEKAADVSDTSLRVPPGVHGTIVEVRVFNRHGVDKDERALAIERGGDRASRQGPRRRAGDPRPQRLQPPRRAAATRPPGIAGPKGLKAAAKITRAVLEEIRRRSGGRSRRPTTRRWARSRPCGSSSTSRRSARAALRDKVEKLQRGDELPPGVMKMVKVFVAVKRKLQPGDKMAGRHGNKGVISRILPIEDMPYLEDGTPVDVVLNPLGVPSRMNVGQILETHLGWACAGLGRQIARPARGLAERRPAKPLIDLTGSTVYDERSGAAERRGD